MPTSRIVIAGLLIASAVTLAVMIPGGFVETRDFSGYPPPVLGAFNAFLTVLGLGSLVLASTALNHGRGRGAAALAGLGYVGVYLLDLGRLFPVPPTPMPTLLATLEWIGTGLGLALVAAALALPRHTATPTVTSAAPSLSAPVAFGLALVALVIIAFATKSAMGI